MNNHLIQTAILQCQAYTLCEQFEFFALDKSRLYKKQYKLLMRLGETA
jgi:hypothetical protein